MNTGECVWPPLCNAKFLAVFVSEGAGGPTPRKSPGDGNPYAGAGVSTIYTSSEGAHISTRGLHILALSASSGRALADLQFC